MKTAKTGLELPFRWWDGVVAVVVLSGSVAASAFVEVGGFWRQLVASGVLVIYLALRRKLAERTVFGESASGRGILVAVGIGLAFVILYAGLLAGIHAVAGLEDPVYPDWTIFIPLMEVPITALAGSVVLAPVLEEVVFRSMLYRGLLTVVPLWVASGVSAVAFGVMHFLAGSGVVTGVASIVISLVVIWLYNRTRSLWSAIVVHATVNSALILYAYIAARIVGYGTTLT